MKIWKKNMVAAAILVTVCAGIYVNWLYGEEQQVVSLVDTLDESKLMESDVAAIADDMGVDADTTSAYFAAVRLSRQEARDSAVSLLQEAMAYNEDTESVQTNAELERIVQTALCEAQIESLVIAKGYTDCVAYISDSGIAVAVASPEGGLVESDVAVIADVVMSQSEFDYEDIRVVEVQ